MCIRDSAFTGSTEVGRDVARAAAERLIPATLELGGKSANIIFPDAKWDMMLDGIQLGILFNQGQVCCAGSRIFVHEDIYDKFVEDACEAFSKVKVGMPWEDDTQMGSQIDPVSYTHLDVYKRQVGEHAGERMRVDAPAGHVLGAGVVAAFHYENGTARGGQPVGCDRAGAPGADDDRVELIIGHGISLSVGRVA